VIICLCHGVSDRTVKGCIEQGKTTVAEIGRECKAGTDCGSCRTQLFELIQQHSAPEQPQLTLVRNNNSA